MCRLIRMEASKDPDEVETKVSGLEDVATNLDAAGENDLAEMAESFAKDAQAAFDAYQTNEFEDDLEQLAHFQELMRTYDVNEVCSADKGAGEAMIRSL